MQQNGVRTGYFLAISLLLSSVMYFFASNWSLMAREQKIGVSVAILVLFYLLSYGLSFVKRHSFLSNWLLVAGSLAFGISVALLGQIYNSHADSYMLFVVWLIPNLLFAIFTRYQPFYVTSYVLAHLAIYFFLDPSVVHVTREDVWWFMMYWLIALGNIILFWLTSTGKWHSKPIYYLSFLTFSVSLFGSSFTEVYGPLPELLYVLTGGILFVTFLKWVPSRGFLIVTASLLSLFVLIKFISYMVIYFSEGFFVLMLLLTVLIVWGAVVGINWLRKESTHQKSKWVVFFQEAFTVLVTTIAASIGAISLAGLLFLIMEDERVIDFLFFLSLIGFLGPVLFIRTMNATVRYTLLTMGYMLGVASVLFLEGAYWIIFLLVLVYVWISVPAIPVRLLTQLTFLAVLATKLDEYLPSFEYVLLILFVTQLAMHYVKQLPVVLQNSSLVYALLSLLILTEEYSQSLAGNVVVNLAFFLFSTYLLYRTLHQQNRVRFGIVLGFWFAFLLMKYYDMLWSLLHKSLSLLLLSLVFFIATLWWDRRSKIEWPNSEPSIFTRKALVLLPVILLQFVLIGYQVWSSETILANGKTVKLELVPIDPRSLLQGDYVILGYTISTLDQEDIESGEKIRVVLRQQANGLYSYSGFYEIEGQWNRTYEPQSSDVVINGNTIGSNRVEYGIESYFVPEGTGLEVERNAKYAIVKIGERGDAILESLSNQ
ncbi:GDYXXLXY domain-containing protein [Brevibacillus fortis]|uniref:GDYXXLXY domain-containing protein n=1 Tax=Brevibacillus fortis TaxID=2126352 RepID=UPI002E1CB047|nr:GDYXXLXY domain-containing protein [Brevibacillus fortis]